MGGRGSMMSKQQVVQLAKRKSCPRCNTEKTEGNALCRRFRVCTDVDDLELDGTVSTAIRARIEQSRTLLVVCSEAAPRRRYVAEEISAFQAVRGSERILAAVLDVQPEEAFPLLFAPGTI